MKVLIAVVIGLFIVFRVYVYVSRRRDANAPLLGVVMPKDLYE